jgi:ketosteroid isomerase-like protein
VDDLRLAETALLDALRRGDLTAVGDRLRDDFLITTARWLPEPVGKAAWLAGLEDAVTLESFTLKVVDSRRHGDTAVVLVESSQTGTHAGTRFSMTFRYTDTWVLERDRWQLAVRHASAMPPKAGPPFPL